MSKSAQLGRRDSIIVSLSSYIAATVLCFVSYMRMPEHWEMMPKFMVAAAIATFFIFIMSYLLKNSSMYDPFWSVQPMVFGAGLVAAYGIENVTTHQWITVIGMQLYGLRLTSNFYRDWPGLSHEDWRYKDLAEKSGKAYWLVSLSGIHFFPTVQVFMGCLPAFYLFAAENTGGDSYLILSILGWVVLYGSVLLAFVADEQMRNFRRNPENKSKTMDQGLWSRNRHPNYLGECLTWVGLWILILAYNPSYWWTGCGAIAILIMFYGVSIPWMDRRSLERRPGFDEYMKRTGRLFPKLF